MIIVRARFRSPSPLRLIVPCTSTQAQKIQLFLGKGGKAITIELLPKLRANEVVHR